jgi:rhamnosyltransferase
MIKKVSCVLVTYNPTIRQLEETIYSIAGQVSYIIIVDNGSTTFSFKDIDNLVIISLRKNYGIAYAQNYGIELAKQQNVDFVLLSDQDTIYPCEFVLKMMDVYEKCKRKECIGAITPIFYDKNKKTESLISITKFKAIVPDKMKIYYISHAISSGSLIPMASLKIIGGMCDELFIDYVDFEWCGRALKYGYKIISVPDVLIEHALGDEMKKICNKKIALRNRVRYYYILRNGIYIIFHKKMLKFYEIILFFRELIIKAMGICLIERKPIPLIYKAVHDGISGSMYEIKGHI